MKRLAVLTGGGDAPGLNAVIRAVVKTAENEYNCEVLGVRNGFDGLFRMVVYSHWIQKLCGAFFQGVVRF